MLCLSATLLGCAGTEQRGTEQLGSVDPLNVCTFEDCGVLSALVHVCAAGDCDATGRRYPADQVLSALHRLLAANDGLEYKLCESDKRSRQCIAENVGHTVFAMVVPGPGTQSSGTIRNPQLNASSNTIRMNKSDPKQFFGTPVICSDHGSTITMTYGGHIVLTDDRYWCNWAAVGIMTAEFSFAIESIDFEKGRITGFWFHALTGTGNGSGTGFAALQFQKGMPKGENWLGAPSVVARNGAHAPGAQVGGPPLRVSSAQREAPVRSVAGAGSSPDWFKPLHQGDYASIVAMMEKRIQGDANPRSSKLLPLCIAYGRLEQHGKAASCFDRLEANVLAGDTDAFEHDAPQVTIFLYGTAWCFECAGMTSANLDRGSVVASMHIARAEHYLALRQYAKAIAAANEYLKLMPLRYLPNRTFREAFQVHPIGVIGIAYALSGNRQAAERVIRALEIATDRGVQVYRMYTIARIHLALGDFQKAYQLLGNYDPPTVPWLDKVLGSKHDAAFRLIPVRFLKHKTQLEVGETAAAKAGFDSLLSEREARENGEIHWMLLYDSGRLAAQEGDLPGAIAFWKRAIDLIEQQRSTIDTEAIKIGFVGDKQAVYRALVAALFAQNRYAEAFDFVERSKARALVDLLAGKTDFALVAPDAEKIKQLLASAHNAELDSRGQLATDERQRSAAIRSAAMATVRQEAADLASLVTVGSASIADIQAGLPEDEALIEYYYDDKALYAFVLTREGLRAAKLDGVGLEAEVRALRRAVAVPVGGEYEPLGRKLYARLIQPLESLGLKKKLLVVPHGVLHYLPFAALRGESGYVIDRHSLRFLPSASVIRYLRSSSAAGRAGILALGNPDLGDPKFDLRFAQDEALAVVQKVPQSRALVRKEATESAFRQYASGFRYVHFATHGEFDADAPLHSALLLAKDGRSDGRLTVDKLYSTRIDADLVTLSACETGLGKVANGDDVVGLTRGFLYAGASTVVASLWKVDDHATSALMIRFYEELRSGDKREALRAAQLAARAQFTHPFFWAAFQLTGTAR
jgi:CHAT domain-containing protein